MTHLDRHGLSLEAQDINHENWYYEEREGIRVVHEVRSTLAPISAVIRTDEILIPWRMLRRSLQRKERGRRPSPLRKGKAA